MKIRTLPGNRIPRLLLRLLLMLSALSAVLALWTARAEALAHCAPECPQENLLPILQKEALTEADYALLFHQTGLARPGIDELYASNRQWELLGLQQRFFASAEVECSSCNLVTRSERLTNFRSIVYGVDFLPTVQTGDILITFNGHVFGWRSGHAAIVVDAKERLTLEAIMPGCDSGICSLESWEEYPGFALLRLKGASAEEREEIAAYAREYLTGLPYSLTALTCEGEGRKAMRGIDVLGAKDAPPAPRNEASASAQLSGTQCAHLVWYAYYHFGYDLDSDGGFVVTPHDIYHSGLLELVQIYGLPANS